MRQILLMTIVAIAAFFTACQTSHQKSEPVPAALKTPVTAIEADERFLNVDSVIVVFYDDPFGKDSLRYTRYYKQVSVTDSSFLTQLKNGLHLPFTKLEKVKPCRSQGKLWLYSQHKIFQTLYFAYAKPGCAHLYFIKDGMMYYVDILQPMIDTLEKLRPLAKAP